MSMMDAGYNPNGLRKFQKTITFTGAAGAGAQGTVTVGTVTGRVFAPVLTAHCTVDLVGANATIVYGVAADTDAFGGQITATNWDVGEWWTAATGLGAGAATVATTASSDATTSSQNKAISTDLILTVATADITAGAAVFTVWYYPDTANGSIA